MTENNLGGYLQEIRDRGYEDGLHQVRYVRAPYPDPPESDAYARGYEAGSAAAAEPARGSRQRPGQPVSQKGAVTGTIETPPEPAGVIERASGAVVDAVGTGVTSGVTTLVAGAVVLGGTVLALGIFSRRRRRRTGR